MQSCAEAAQIMDTHAHESVHASTNPTAEIELDQPSLDHRSEDTHKLLDHAEVRVQRTDVQ